MATARSWSRSRTSPIVEWASWSCAGTRSWTRSLFLAPFRPSEQRIRDGGPPLVQDWSKWVRGPGESGEPAGTTSLGWGPLLPAATLTIPIQVTRQRRGEVAFDLQVLAGEAILSLADGGAGRAARQHSVDPLG